MSSYITTATVGDGVGDAAEPGVLVRVMVGVGVIVGELVKVTGGELVNVGVTVRVDVTVSVHVGVPTTTIGATVATKSGLWRSKALGRVEGGASSQNGKAIACAAIRPLMIKTKVWESFLEIIKTPRRGPKELGPE